MSSDKANGGISTNDSTNVKETSLKEGNTNAVTHGAYSYLARGIDALSPAQVDLHTQLQVKALTRPGVVELMQKQAVDTCMIVSLLQADVLKKSQEGKQIHEIGTLKMLAVYMNAAQRALHELYAVLPSEDRGAFDAQEIINKYREGGEDAQNS